jgi:hypothetical protein
MVESVGCTRDTETSYNLSFQEFINYLNGLNVINNDRICFIWRLLLSRFSKLLPFSILAIWPAHLNFKTNHPECIRWTIQTSNFLIVEPSSFHIHSFLLVLNIRLRVLFSNTFSLHSSISVRVHLHQPSIVCERMKTLQTFKNIRKHAGKASVHTSWATSMSSCSRTFDKVPNMAPGLSKFSICAASIVTLSEIEKLRQRKKRRMWESSSFKGRDYVQLLANLKADETGCFDVCSLISSLQRDASKEIVFANNARLV